MDDQTLVSLTADIVSAHVSNNSIATADLPVLIRNVYAALEITTKPVELEPAKAEPAVSIRASIKPDYLVCLEDGAKLTMLKRYLRTRYGMSPEEYRAKWDLPRDYPMVAPNYAERRRTLAHSIGLGRRKVADEAASVTAPVKRGASKMVDAVEGAVASPKPARKPRAKKAAAAPASNG